MIDRNRLESRVERRGGFTLIELLVVIAIILIVSAVALPVVLPALRHRQVSEGARILQGALVGARDTAIHGNAPSGIRLLPDPAFPVRYIQITLPNGTVQTRIDPAQPLAANRIIPIESAPEYSEGLVVPVTSNNAALNLRPYPCLMIAECVVNSTNLPGLPNAPTSWFWNIRVGDKIQLNGAGIWYTVVGPMVIPPDGTTLNGVFYANPELFVNIGPPGLQSPLNLIQGPPNALTSVFPEFLFLVNGQDDNNNGWIDEGFDGVDNNNNGFIDESVGGPSGFGEWEIETWQGTLAGTPVQDQSYTIQRRPTPTTNAREVSLPSNVVIDLTTWAFPYPTQANPNFTPSLERSRLPVNIYNGYVDILVYPNGTVVPTTIYSTPASVGLSGSFLHFWLAERSDVVAPPAYPPTTLPPYLPIGNIQQTLASTPYPGPRIQGEYRLLTVFTRTGQLTTADDVQFDNPAYEQVNGFTYNPNYPFLAAQQGIRGGR